MKYSVQTDNVGAVHEALGSRCDIIRFGSEFCEWKIPSLKELEEAYLLVDGDNKEFFYITPTVSNECLEKIRDQLAFLENKGEITVIVNDLGVLNIVEQFSNLKPHMGRQLVTILARTPWNQITEYDVGYMKKRRVSKVFYQTSVNYEPTIQLFKEHGAEGVDLDWISESIPNYSFISENGLSISVYLYLVPISVTRRCNMARFLGEEEPKKCTKPCDTTALFLEQKKIPGIDIFLLDNGVFRLTKPLSEDINRLHRMRVEEFVIPMNPLTNIRTHDSIDKIIQTLRI
ncbi:MAG: hypothetical protein QG670_2639 [Thermoproteota archaeon]|nr:hypothetical protein [Thermoproteota archaeon]